MNIIIRTENLTLTESLKAYIEKKVLKIEKYFHKHIESTAHIKTKITNNEQIVEITIPLRNVILRTEESHDDLYAAIDLAVDKIERQIRKYKTKVNRKQRLKQMKSEEITFDLNDMTNDYENEEEDIKIQKVKGFNFYKPMSPEEAVLQMNCLGHNFFVFLNSETNQPNIVYKRKNNTYGLMEQR